MNQNDLFFHKLPSIRSAIQKSILSLSQHDLVQINLSIDNNTNVEFIEGNEVNDVLRSVINFQNSLMRGLINCQASGDNFADLKIITASGDDHEGDFSKTKFTTIEPIRKVTGTLLRFYASKGAINEFPSALENYNAQKEGFEQLVLPQVDVVFGLASQSEAQLFSLLFTGFELMSLGGDFEIQKPNTREFCEFLPNFVAEYFENLDQVHLFALIIVANATFSKKILDLLCAQVANMIRGKSPEQIRDTFNIKNDFTPEEEEAVRRENSWVEE